MSKYHNRKTVIDGIVFDSKKEAARYQELKLLEAAGEIKYLICHPRLPIGIDGVKVCDYIADFSYWQDGHEVIEDCKGFKTAIYNLKKKLVRAVYGFDIFET